MDLYVPTTTFQISLDYSQNYGKSHALRQSDHHYLWTFPESLFCSSLLKEMTYIGFGFCWDLVVFICSSLTAHEAEDFLAGHLYYLPVSLLDCLFLLIWGGSFFIMYIFLWFVINVYFQIVVSAFMLSLKLTYSKTEIFLVYRSMNFDIYDHHHNQTAKQTVPSCPKMPFVLPL